MSPIARLRVACLFSMFLACVVPAGASDAGPAQDAPTTGTRFHDLATSVAARFDAPSFAHAHWGVLIQSLKTGEVWYERNADRLFLPASNQKIPTTAAALKSLGPEFRFQTLLCTDGRVTSTSIEGNVVVFGDGDPTFYTRFYKEPVEVFRSWARQLRERGIHHISGDIIGDDNAWDDEHIGGGWALDNLDSWSGAEFGALQLNENYIDVKVIAPADTSGTVEIVPSLPSRYYRLVNKVTVGGGGGGGRVRMTRDVKSNEIVVSGTVPPGSGTIEQSPTITNPTLFYVTVLKEVFEQEGIAVSGDAVDCDDLPGWKRRPEDFTRLIEHRSPPLAEIAKVLMKRSQNLYAETLVHAMGRHATGLGSFAAGRRVVQEQLKAFGVEPGNYSYRDGSGLSRYNYISPRQLGAILRGMHDSPLWPVWRDAMPIAGVDGTLGKRMKGTPAGGNVRAKTGTIANVRSLSGYVTTAAGEELVFSFIVNAHLRSDRETEEVMDGVLTMLAGYGK